MSLGYYRAGSHITLRWDRLGKGKKLNHPDQNIVLQWNETDKVQVYHWKKLVYLLVVQWNEKSRV